MLYILFLCVVILIFSLIFIWYGSTKKIKNTLLIYIMLMMDISAANGQENITTTTYIKPFINNDRMLLDSRLRFLIKKNTTTGAIVDLVPMQYQSQDNNWKFIQSYYLFLKDALLGKLILGGHRGSTELLRVDATTFAVGGNDVFYTYNSFVKNIFATPETLKLSYLSPLISETFNFATAFEVEGLSVQLLHSNTINDSIDYKIAGGFTGKSQKIKDVNIGFNMQYLGVIIGGSYGKNIEHYYTTGVGYSIASFKTSLTYCKEKQFNNTTLGAEYKINKNIIQFIQIRVYNSKESTTMFGIKFIL